jgi:hypothetical protein
MTSERPVSRPQTSPLSVALGKRLKQCRHVADKSQETLANICHALGVTLAELLGPISGVPLAPTGARRANAAAPPRIVRQRLR